VEQITREKVFQKIDEMTASADVVSLRKLRERLGGGSQSTIHKYLKEWREKNHVAKQSRMIEIPANILDAISSALGESLAAGRAEVESELVLARDENDELAKLLANCEADKETLTAHFEAMRTDKDMLAGKLEQIDMSLTAVIQERESLKKELEVTRDVAEKLRTELVTTLFRSESSTNEIAEIKEEKTHLADELKKTEASRIAAEKEAAVSITQVDMFRADLERERKDHEKIVATLRNDHDQERRRSQEEIDRLQTAHKDEIGRLRNEIERIRKESGDKEAKLELQIEKLENEKVANQ